MDLVLFGPLLPLIRYRHHHLLHHLLQLRQSLHPTHPHPRPRLRRLHLRHPPNPLIQLRDSGPFVSAIYVSGDEGDSPDAVSVEFLPSEQQRIRSSLSSKLHLLRWQTLMLLRVY